MLICPFYAQSIHRCVCIYVIYEEDVSLFVYFIRFFISAYVLLLDSNQWAQKKIFTALLKCLTLCKIDSSILPSIFSFEQIDLCHFYSVYISV